DNLAKNLGRPRREKGVERPEWSVAPQYDVLDGYSQDELVDVLAKQCESIHTNFKQTDSVGLTQAIKETMEAYGVKSVIAADDERNNVYGLYKFYKDLEGEDINVHVWDSPSRSLKNLYSPYTLFRSSSAAITDFTPNASIVSLI